MSDQPDQRDGSDTPGRSDMDAEDTAAATANCKRRRPEEEEEVDEAAAAAEPEPAAFGGGIGSKLLRLAGYSGVGGLGKRGTGIAEPVAASTQIATRGLGFEDGVKRQVHTFEAFKVEIEITPTWLITPDSADGLPTASDMADWLREGPRDPECITDERYCSSALQRTLLAAKSAFDDVPSSLFRSARERSNPFERIKGEFFQNRAALKMAEMDAACGRIFTAPPVVRAARKRELITIGDICAGPGGFSEYMLTVLKWRGVVCGFTLRDGASDFNTHRFNINAPTHSFHAFYGRDGTGDITRSENIRDYRDKVMAVTKGRGLHVVMGDGGFSVVNRENYQEYLSRQLVLCQFLTAFATLAQGGVFVCKLFDSFLPFTVDLLFLVRTHFTHFSLVKPNQSRPANSERYVVAHGLKRAQAPVVEYLFRANDRINELRRTYTSQPADRANFNFPSAREEAMRERERRIKEAAARGAGKFVSGGRLNQEDRPPSPDPLADRGDGRDMFGRDIVPRNTPAPDAAAAAAASDASGEASNGSNGATVKSEPTDSAAASSSSSSSPPAAPAAPVTALSTERDVLGLVPAHLVSSDSEFVSYMIDRNESIARRQVFTLHRLKQYVEDPGLPSDDQETARRQCLDYWCLSQQPLPPPPDPTTLERRVKQPKEEAAKKKKSSKSRRRRHRSRSHSRSPSRSGSGSDSDRSRGRSRTRRRRGRRSRRSSESSGSSRSRSRSHSRSSSRSSSRSGSSRSRSRSRSYSRTPPPSRSPSPAAEVAPFKKLYVHFDPLWRARLFDPTFPHNPRSFFWTSAAARRMIQYHVADDLTNAKVLLPLPGESERAKLRMRAEQFPDEAADARMVQLDHIARSARSWFILPVPAGGIRHTVWFSASAMGHIDEHGVPHLWAMEPRMKVPADTLLDVVWSGGVMYVLDAYALPSPADLAMYRTRPRLLERLELAELFVESCGESRLKAVKPIPLLEWKRSPLMHDHSPTFDLFFLRDGARPPAAVSYSWTDTDDFSLPEVNDLLLYIASKQAPAPGSMHAAPPRPPQQQR